LNNQALSLSVRIGALVRVSQICSGTLQYWVRSSFHRQFTLDSSPFHRLVLGFEARGGGVSYAVEDGSPVGAVWRSVALEKEERMSSQRPRWYTDGGRVQWMTVGVAVFVTLAILVYFGYGTEWTGFGETRVGGEVQPAKTLWEWLGLLIVPLMLAAGGFMLNRWQVKRDEQARQLQVQSEKQAQEAHKEREELAAKQRAQDEALRAYLDQMSNLMVDRRMREHPAGSDTHRLAQARTIAILLGLDEDRKRRPLKLVYELRLIPKENPILSLSNAGLDTADLSEMTLRDACLREADLRRANLRGADLRGSDLTKADLRGADLTNANLTDTCLEGANLLPYDPRNPAKLNAPNLSNGTDPLRDVDLGNEHLVRTDLTGANLTNADLHNALLNGAVVTERQLRACRTYEGAVLSPELELA
jgi:hypothetical protein